jgi:peptide/nickel transport system permease protein
MTHLIARRLAGALALLLAISALLFAATELLPGDAATASLGAGQTPERVAQLRQERQLDRGPLVRYGDWLGHALRGDLGTSVQTERPVRAMIAPALGATALLAGIAWFGSALIAVALGVVAGTRVGTRRDTLISTAALGVLAIPEMVWAVALIALFASALGVLPAVSLVPAGSTPLDDPTILVLPAACLVLTGGAWATRMVRAAVAEQARAPHVEAARLAGLDVLCRHLLPGALGPCAQALAWLVALMVGGTAIVEQAFNYPGLTQILVAAVRTHDLPVLEATGLLLAAAVGGALLLADLLVLAVDPRARRR